MYNHMNLNKLDGGTRIKRNGRYTKFIKICNRQEIEESRDRLCSEETRNIKKKKRILTDYFTRIKWNIIQGENKFDPFPNQLRWLWIAIDVSGVKGEKKKKKKRNGTNKTNKKYQMSVIFRFSQISFEEIMSW